LGNEQDLNYGTLDQSEYKALYAEFAAAMHNAAEMNNEDPNIKTGPGLSSNTTWLRDLLLDGASGPYVNFVSAHQYTFNNAWTQGGFPAWRDNTANIIPNITGIQDTVNEEAPGREILVTELSSFGGWPEGAGGLADTYRALALFEMEMEAISM
jgi:hypothetical protein